MLKNEIFKIYRRNNTFLESIKKKKNFELIELP